MLIPLDYYRILGLPIQATAEQIQQAYRDRSRQLPRREYSETAVRARKQLIDEAYETLSDADARARYDATFLSKTYDGYNGESPLDGSPTDNGTGAASTQAVKTPSLEIEDDRLVGALAILLELGEYDRVLSLGRPQLPHSSEAPSGREAMFRSDVALTLAVAYLEMGREQWQQAQYENAAASLEAGQALLLREGLVPQVRGEMQNDLQRLRPYRILELLALPLEEEALRQRGLQLLRDMLQERGGLDGSGDDGSGLNVDDFLRFIQQLRQYTTAAEQQALFEMEARRPSAVATYLAVYALIGRGFAQGQPGLIYRAKLLLVQLGRRQDVHLEQSVCALLLGQTEQATRALELSREEDPLTFIRQHSQGSPDLLPGLCLYGERWLQEDVFPHFRDLANLTASLKEYFADPSVQRHLESLPPETEESAQWVVSATQTAMPPPDAPDWRSPSSSVPVLAGASPALNPSVSGSNGSGSNSFGAGDAGSSTGSWQTPSRAGSGSSPSRPSWSVSGAGGSASGMSSPRRTGATGVATPRLPLSSNPFGLPEESGEGTPPNARRSRRSRRSGLQVDRLLLLIGAGVLSLLVLWFLLTSILGGLAALLGLSGPKLEPGGADVGVSQPLYQLPPPEARPDPDAPLTAETAQETIETWFSVKSAAMGSDRDTSGLSSILTEPALSEWRQTARSAEANGWYWDYSAHEVTVDEVAVDPDNEDLAVVTTQVREAGTLYDGGQAVRTEDNDDLAVAYTLVRDNDTWKIQDWVVE